MDIDTENEFSFNSSGRSREINPDRYYHSTSPNNTIFRGAHKDEKNIYNGCSLYFIDFNN